MVVTAPVRHRFNVEDWDRLIELGFFTADDHVELLDGEIIDMAPMGDRHSTCVRRLNTLLVRAVGDVALVNVGCPVRLSHYSDPEPDFALLRPKEDWYRSGRPWPADTLLVIEVSDSSLALDKGLKRRLYAGAGIAEYWVVDVDHQVVEVSTDPADGAYRSHEMRRRGDALRPSLVPTVALAVDDILG
jgi:Uma2 family endonuclease